MPATSTDVLTRSIGARLRALRTDRGWSQSVVAHALGMSQARLSTIERGAASLTAEQFVLALRLYRVGLGAFAPDLAPAPDADLRAALHALGAGHLVVPEGIVPSEALQDPSRVVVETLLSRDPRLITALAPVLVGHIDEVNLPRVFNQLDRAGVASRLGWLLDNVVLAIDELDHAGQGIPLRARRAFARTKTVIEAFVDRIETDAPDTGTGPSADLLDASLRSARSVSLALKVASTTSNLWNIVTSIQPSDFTEALRDGFLANR